MPAKITGFKFTKKAFDRWRKRQTFPDQRTADLALMISKNLKQWEAGAHRSDTFRAIVMEQLAELQARMIKAAQP